ncbi:MAG TPA: hypothetical protein ENN43_00130 [bacterium]|nr:hypothetical protein [bacterium]
MKTNFAIAIIILALLAPLSQAAGADDDYSIAYINDFSGDCEIKRKGERTGEALRDIFIPLYEGDTVITEAGSTMEIVFDDATVLKLDPYSRLVIRNLKRDKKNTSTVLELIKGRVMGVIKKLTDKEEFAVRTKLAMAAVKGTELLVETGARGDDDKVAVFKGKVEVSSFDMSGKVRHRVILNDNKETLIVKRIGPEKPKSLSRNTVRKYNEIKDARKKLDYIREMRRSGKAREYRLERRLERIDNLKRMRSSDPSFKKLDPKQKELIDEIIRREEYYRAQLGELKKKEKRPSRIQRLLDRKSGKNVPEESDE